MKTTTMILIAALALTACSSAPKYHEPVLVAEKERVVIAPSLIADCEAPPKFEVRRYNEGEVVKHLNDWVTAFDTCRINHHKLSGLVRKAFNIDPTDDKKQPSK